MSVLAKDGLVFAHITEYMRAIRRPRDGALGALEIWAREHDFPVSEPETADLLYLLCKMKQPARILEIGTCIGFSAMLMHEAAPNAKIVTMERNPAMFEPAEENFRKFGVEEAITFLKGDAAKLLETEQEPYDLIFLDAAKGQYPVFWEHCKRLLPSGGVFVADNVLFNGYVAKGKPDRHRNKTIVMRLDAFLKALEADTDMDTVILPISDGVTFSVRK